jgi:serine/threonine protein phosphatase PrpC
MSNPGSFEIHAFACTDTGRVRKTNEDSLYVANLSDGTGIEDSGILRFPSGACGALFAVADGMGGAAAGEMASRICLQTLYGEIADLMRSERHPDPESVEQMLINAVGTANRRIYDLSRSYDEYAGMGTTLTTALELHGSLVIGQVGDSRGYLICDDGIRQVTRDQSLVAKMVSDGELTLEEARRHPERNILLQAVGVRDSVELALKRVTLYPNDNLLLCSDGLHSQVFDDEMCEIVLSAGNARDACLQLVALANKRGGPDNITAVLVRFLPLSHRL